MKIYVLTMGLAQGTSIPKVNRPTAIPPPAPPIVQFVFYKRKNNHIKFECDFIRFTSRIVSTLDTRKTKA